MTLKLLRTIGLVIAGLLALVVICIIASVIT